MKHSKTCIKCGGKNIVMIQSDGREGAYGNNIQCGLTILSAVLIERYICCDCGYTEEWVNKADIEQILKSKKVIK